MSDRIQSAKALDKTAAQLKRVQEVSKPKVATTTAANQVHFGKLQGSVSSTTSHAAPGRTKASSDQKIPYTEALLQSEAFLRTETGIQEGSLEVLSYAGRLKYFVVNWYQITSDPVLLSWIQGLRLLLARKVVQLAIPSPPNWSCSEIRHLTSSLEHLLHIGAISKCSPCKNQFISNIFLVPKPDGSYRLILNLKRLNNFIDTQHFVTVSNHRCY